MTTLRSRLLSTLVLAAVILSALGTGAASARTFQRRVSPVGSNAAAPRPGMGRFTGEPDPSGSGAPTPPNVEKTSLVLPSPGLWLVQRWLQWKIQNPDPRGRSRH
jgi:hypothetical protein